jgi:magnesium chelatase subunit D
VGERRDTLERAAVGHRARSLVSRRHGKYSRHRLARHGDRDIAVDATLRAAAVRTAGVPIAVGAEDLRRRVREHRSPLAVCFVLDNSYSVHAERMVEKVKGLVYRLLADSAHRGDRVALVAFKGGLPEATVVVPLTRGARLALRRLRDVPLSGRTPLADALSRSRRLLRQESVKRPNAVPVVVVVSDGLPTVPLVPRGDPLRDAVAEARRLRRSGIRTVVVDSAADSRASCGRELAAAAHGVHLAFGEVSSEALEKAFGA